MKNCLRRVIVAGAVLAVCSVYVIREHAIHRQVRANLQTAVQVSLSNIRAEGLPVSAQELAAWAAGPPLAENAADWFCLATNRFYRPAAARRRWADEPPEVHPPIAVLPIVGRGKVPLGTEVMETAAREAAAALLASNAEALVLLHQAAGMGHGRFAIDWTAPNAIRLPHLEPIRYGTKLLQLEALLHIEQWQPQQAVESLRASFAITRWLATEPAVISQLVRFSCDLQGVAVLERLLSCTGVGKLDAAGLADDLLAAEDGAGLTAAYAAERCGLIHAYQQLRTTPWSWRQFAQDLRQSCWREIIPWVWEFWRLRRRHTSGLADLEFLVALEHCAARIRISQLPFPQRLAAARTHRALGELLAEQQMLFLYMPASIGAISKHAHCTARLRAARAALSVEQHRSADGAPPETVSIDITDPFTGEPLRYRKLARGYVVYALGENQKDDGGDQKQDVAFRVER